MACCVAMLQLLLLEDFSFFAQYLVEQLGGRIFALEVQGKENLDVKVGRQGD